MAGRWRNRGDRSRLAEYVSQHAAMTPRWLRSRLRLELAIPPFYSRFDHARESPMSRAPACRLASFALVAVLSTTACAKAPSTEKDPNGTPMSETATSPRTVGGQTYNAAGGARLGPHRFMFPANLYYNQTGPLADGASCSLCSGLISMQRLLVIARCAARRTAGGRYWSSLGTSIAFPSRTIWHVGPAVRPPARRGRWSEETR